jgi:dethiobiotin synthetase
VANTDLEIARMLKQFRPENFVIVEATGGLEAPVASAFATARIALLLPSTLYSIRCFMNGVLK